MSDSPSSHEPRSDASKTEESSPTLIKRKRRRRSRRQRAAPPKPVGWLAYLTLILLTTAAYLPLFQSGLIWSDYDDPDRSAYRSIDDLGDVWTLETIRKEDPITLSSYFLERTFPLPTGHVHHAINLFLHITAACLFIKVMQALNLPAAFSASLVFAIHPAVMQTMFWSGYREELVGMVLILSALYFGIRNRSPRDYAALIFLSALACLLHPAAVVLPVLLFLCVLHQNPFPRLKDFNHLLPVFCLALFIVIWTQSGSVVFDRNLGDQIAVSSQNFFFYLKQSLLPTELGLFHPTGRTGGFSVGAQYSFLPLFLLLPFYLLIIFNYDKIWARSILVGLTAFLLLSAYGLLSDGMFLDGGPARENHLHYLALPFILALFVSPLGGLFETLGKGGRVLWNCGFTIFVLLQLSLTVSYSLTVGQPATMWQQMSEQWPGKWLPKLALVETIEDSKDSEGLLTVSEKIELMESIIRTQPELTQVRVALARTYRSDGQNGQALRHYRQITRQEEPTRALLVEAADFYEELGLDWDVRNTRQLIDELETSSTLQPQL